VNSELVSLYWDLGQYLSHKIDSAEWGDGVINELAIDLGRRYPGMRGFARRNLFRMRQSTPSSLPATAPARAGELHSSASGFTTMIG
jgi:hypothetical protein